MDDEITSSLLGDFLHANYLGLMGCEEQNRGQQLEREII